MRPPRRFSHPICLGALALALALLAWDTIIHTEEVNHFTATRGVWTEAPTEDAKSPTGYVLGQRNILLPYEAVDSYHWIMQTQQMFAQGEPRVRHVDYDNAPDGRGVHWASPYRWWLGVVAWAHHLISGRSLPISVERAALYANPLLLAVALLVFTPLVARRFGAMAGAIFAVASAGVAPYSNFYAATIPDHHGLATLCGFLCVLFLVAGGGGWFRAQNVAAVDLDPLTRWLPDSRQARNWFVASGIAGGIGLWVSAASQVLVLVAIGCAAWLAGLLTKLQKSPIGLPTSEPKLWRIWGLAGAATSLVTYLVEYFPAGSGWRLEVNHPLYALAWAGAGELLNAWYRWCTRGRWTESALDGALLPLAAVAVASQPLVVLVSHADTFWVADHFLFRLHKYYIQEFQPLISSFKSRSGFFPVLQLVPTVTFLLSAFCIKRARANGVLRSLLIVAFCPAAVMFLFSFGQSRWFGVSYGLLLAGFIFLGWTLFETEFLRRGRAWILVFLIVCSLSAPVRTFATWANGETTTSDDVYQLALRDLAWWLRTRTGTEPCVVASSPTLSTFLIFHGGIQGLGTFYWENLHGLRASADLFSASSAEEAERIVREHGVTHLVMVSWDDFVSEYVRLEREINKGTEAPDGAFVLDLIKTKILPPWLKLVPYRFPKTKVLEEQVVYVFEVVPTQPPEAQLVNLVNYLIDIGEIQTATRFEPALERLAQYLPAQIARARIHLMQNDEAAVRKAMVNVLPLLPTTEVLSLEDNIQLGFLLAVTGETVSAQEQFSRCVTRMNEHDARRLSANAVYNFLYMAPRLGTASPSQQMVELLFEILPPKMRDQLHQSVSPVTN